MFDSMHNVNHKRVLLIVVDHYLVSILRKGSVWSLHRTDPQLKVLIAFFATFGQLTYRWVLLSLWIPMLKFYIAERSELLGL